MLTRAAGYVSVFVAGGVSFGALATSLQGDLRFAAVMAALALVFVLLPVISTRR